MRKSLVLFLTFCFITAAHATAAVKVAVLGDSITYGSSAKVREKNRYSSRLGHLLGEAYDVRSFGASSLCMLRKADLPFVTTKLFKQALAYKPDIAIITLGTNDTCLNTVRQNWKHHSDLRDDALFMINSLKKANPKITIHLCSPPPMFPNQPGLRPKRKNDLAERAHRLPEIRQAYAAVAAQSENVHYHDLSRALRSGETTDGVHPHTFGHERLANHYFELVTQPVGKRARFDKISRARSRWHGFERHDYQLPKTGAKYTLVIPHTAAKGQPWIWRARFFSHQPALDLALLDRGYHLAYVDLANLYGSDEAMERCDEFYQFLTHNFDLKKKSILEGMSRGGLMIFNYAAKYPDRVSAIYGDNPVCDFNSWPGGKNGQFSKTDWRRCLEAYGITADEAAGYPQVTDASFAKKLAKDNIPVALVLGSDDEVVPPSENGEPLAKHIAAAGGVVKVWRKPGAGHHPHGLHPVDPLLRFLLRADGRKINPAARPKPSSEYRSGAGWGGTWWQAFDHLKTQIKKHPDTSIVFIGDSITQGLTGHKHRTTDPNGKRPIDRHYGKSNAISLGLSGDRTEHVLWRLKNGQLDGIHPTHLVLMVGVNNINAGNHTGEETAAGTKAIVEWLKTNKAQTKVLLLGCFSTRKSPADPARAEVDALHRLVKPLADNQTIFYQDLRPLFLRADGTMNDRMSADAIHINAKGQEAWMSAIKAFFSK